nr:hypothetical protein [Chloroflexus sp.]
MGCWVTLKDVPPPILLTANDIGDNRNGPLVILGSRERHPLAAMINASSNTPFVYQPGRSVQATLSIVPSPWQSGARVLLIDAADSDGLRLGVRALREWALLRVLRGSQAQITADPDPTVVSLTNPLQTPPQTLTPRIEVTLLERFPAWQVVGSILLITLVATAVLVIRIRWLRRK